MSTQTHNESCSCWRCLEWDMNQHLISIGVDPSRYGSGPSEADNQQIQLGSGLAGSGMVVNAKATATEKQLNFLATLLATRNLADFRCPKTVDQTKLGDKGYLSTLSRKTCSTLIEQLVDLPVVAGTGPAPTEKQAAYWRTLVQRKLGSEKLESTPVPATRSDISNEIDRLRKLPDHIPSSSAGKSGRVTQDGIYQLEGQVYKVQKSLGSDRVYAKIWDTEINEFRFEKGAVNRLRPENLMTLEQAKEWGHLYGYCCRCGRRLTDETSIAEGIGKVCAGKW